MLFQNIKLNKLETLHNEGKICLSSRDNQKNVELHTANKKRKLKTRQKNQVCFFQERNDWERVEIRKRNTSKRRKKAFKRGKK